MTTHVDALIQKDDKFLAVEIIDHPGSGLHTGMLHLPGGRPEAGESLIEIVRREVLEETGYELNLINDDPIFDQTVDFAGDDHRFVVFGCEIAGGIEKMQEGEIVAIRWVTG
ncbi:NUDIX hydrolase, partial [candidate division WWE3 bacterium]|nr:NUDIX hydrolase [candidate division WWE3 bacterium]